MTTYPCTILSTWSVPTTARQAVKITTPKGGSVTITRLDIDLLTNEEWAVTEKLLAKQWDSTNPMEYIMQLTREELLLLQSASKRCVPVPEAKPQTAPQMDSKGLSVITDLDYLNSLRITDKPKSFAQRKFERSKRIQANNFSIRSGRCATPSCNGKLRLKNHGSWIGYYCPICKGGGSITVKK